MSQIEGFDERLQQIETSVERSNLSIRATINDTFTQLMDRLDELKTQGGPVNRLWGMERNPAGSTGLSVDWL